MHPFSTDIISHYSWSYVSLSLGRTDDHGHSVAILFLGVVVVQLLGLIVNVEVQGFEPRSDSTTCGVTS